MNLFAALILSALLLEYGLFLASRWLELLALAPALPAEFADVVDAERYRRSQDYARARSRLALVSRTALLAALLFFWGLDGFAALDSALAGLSLLPRGLAFLGVLYLLRAFITFPFRWWSTFRIEARFGFNRTSARTFLADQLKSALVTAAIGGPILAGALLILRQVEIDRIRLAWSPWLLAIPAGFAALILALQLLSTAVILPLFLRFRPLADGAARESLLELARRVGFAARDVYVVDGSRRSTKANAFFTGFGRARRIALFDTLLERHPADELAAVVAHELGHWRRRHVWLRAAAAVATMSLFAFALLGTAADPRLSAALGAAAPAPHAAFVAFGLLISPAEVLFGLAFNALSRRHEYAADRFAAEAIGDPEALVRALKRLAADSLENLTPHPLEVALHHGHPPVTARIAALRSGA